MNPSTCVIHVRNGVEKPRMAMTTVAMTHSTEYSSDSLRRRTSSSTHSASRTAPSAVMTWVRERKGMAGLLDRFPDQRHERREQVLVRVVELLAQRVERRARRALAHDHGHLLEAEAAARKRDQQRRVGEVLGEVELAHFDDAPRVRAEARRGVVDRPAERQAYDAAEELHAESPVPRRAVAGRRHEARADRHVAAAGDDGLEQRREKARIVLAVGVQLDDDVD